MRHSTRLPALFATTVLAATTTIVPWPSHAAELDRRAQSATIIGPSNPQLAAGATALDQGRIDEGIRLTLAGLRVPADPRDKAAGYSNLCAGYAMLKQWTEALLHCNTALDLDKGNWRTFNNRAAVYAGTMRWDRAVNDIRAGLKISPNSRTLKESLRIIEQNRRSMRSRGRSTDPLL
jgi:tetratricopeptide (TPR) repeat protein